MADRLQSQAIKSLESTSLQQIHTAFTAAFSDYAEPYTKTLDEVRQMIERRGYEPSISFGAFDGDALASFTLNGKGEWNGQLTTYDTGTGTIPEYPKQGLAARIFEESLPILKQHGISQYLLEVIKVNAKAFELYRKQGFEISREFDYYISTKEQIGIRPAPLNGEYSVKKITTPDWKLLKSFWEFEPSWQNSADAIIRKREAFIILGIFDKDKIAGYVIIEPSTGDVPQLAIAPAYRRKELATELLRHALTYINVDAVKFINADAAYAPFRDFMQSIGMKPGYGQYEMIRKL